MNKFIKNQEVCDFATFIKEPPRFTSSPIQDEQFQCVQLAMKLPLVGTACTQSQKLYSTVKHSNSLLRWAFQTAENTVQLALTTAAPAIRVIDRPLHFMDETLARTIGQLETKVPAVKEEPMKIYQETKDAISRSMENVKTRSVEKVRSLKEISLAKVNQVAASQYGSFAINSLDYTSKKAEDLLDHYLPAEEGAEEVEIELSVVAAEDDRVQHVTQTVSRLGKIVARRVYNKVVVQVEGSIVQRYVASVKKSIGNYFTTLKKISMDFIKPTSPTSKTKVNLY